VRTAVLVPCYNEAATIGKVVSDFRAADPSVVVYVYDNNSTDDSALIAQRASAVVVRENRQGKGWVIRSMFRDIDAEVYVMVDGDDTYSAVEALSMRNLVVGGRADMAMGDRISGTDRQHSGRRFHGWGSRLVRWLVNRIFASDLHDLTTGCRVMSRRFVKTMPIASADFEVETEMTIHALDKGFLVSEAPISYREDRSGRESRRGRESKPNALADGIRVLRTIVRLLRDCRPLLFFGLLAATTFVLSIGLSIPPSIDYITEGYVHKVPMLIVAAAMGVTSLLSLITGLVLDSVRNHARQFFEVTLTGFDMLDAVCRERTDSF
jgi:glycosyltransferase involved in cell wall biosynthesis